MTEQKGGYLYDGPCEHTSVYLETAVIQQIDKLAKAHRRTFNFMVNEMLKTVLGMPSKFGLGEKEE